MPCMYAGNEDTDPSAALLQRSITTILLRYGIKFLRYVKINSKFSHCPTECICMEPLSSSFIVGNQ